MFKLWFAATAWLRSAGHIITMAYHLNNSGVASSRGGTQFTTIDNLSWYSKNSMANLSGPLNPDMSFASFKDTPRSPAGELISCRGVFAYSDTVSPDKSIFQLSSVDIGVLLPQQPADFQEDFGVVRSVATVAAEDPTVWTHSQVSIALLHRYHLQMFT